MIGMRVRVVASVVALLSCCVALSVVCVSAASNVVDLTPATFDAVVDGSKSVLVEFYAPWCGHCKRLAPEYEVAADAFAGSKDVVIAKVDCDAEKELGSRFGVTGFPTLKYFARGAPTDAPEEYTGGRTADEIVEWVTRRSGVRSKLPRKEVVATQLTADNFDDIVLDASKHVVVEFYAPWCGHCKSFAPAYEKIARVFRREGDVVIAQLDADKYREAASKYGVSGFPTIKYFAPGAKDAPEDVQIERSLEAYVKYVNEKAGTLRADSGALLPGAARSDALDALAAKFVAATSDSERDAVIAETEAAAAAAAGSRYGQFLPYYAKTMRSMQKKGAEFASTESARIQRMLASDSVKADKLDEFQSRVNILAAFTSA